MKRFLTFLLVCIFVLSLTTIGSAKPNDENAKKVSDYLMRQLKVKDFSGEFTALKESTDNLGFKHIKLNQKVNGIPVYGGDIIVHIDKDGNAYGISGNYQEKAKSFKKAGILINEKQAVEFAKVSVNFSKDAEDFEVSGKLYLYELSGSYVPAYVVDLSYIYPEAFRWRVFVNAYDGSIISKYDNLKTSPAVGAGKGYIGDTKNINTDLIGSSYYLRDLTKSKGIIYTNDALNRTSTARVSVMSDADNNWNTAYQAPAVDAHYYVGITYDYYKTRFNRISYDNNGRDTKVIAHYGKSYDNAFWDGKQLVFGDGDGTEWGPFSADMDIVAHEYTHAVGDYEGNLQYSYQSGALEEATADLMSIFALDYYKQVYFGRAGGWLFCENAYTPKTPGDTYYSYVDPAKYGYPDHMSKYVNTTSDNGGVHRNCTIIGHAGYTLAQSIGNAKTEQIIYRAICNYYTSQINFSGARTAWLNAAGDLYGINGTEYNSVKAAFDHVGIN